MSSSRLRESRGYSIVASLVVVAILILIVVAIQAALPPLPANTVSQGAQAAAPNTTQASSPATDPAKAAATDEQKKLAQLCQAAVDACQKDPSSCNQPREKKSSTATTAPIDDCVGAVPDASTTQAGGATQTTKYRCTGRTAKATFLTDVSGGPGSYDVQSYPDGSVAPGQCKTIVCTPDVGSSPIGNLPLTGVTSLKCGTASAISGLNQGSLSNVLSGANTFNMTRSYYGSTFTPASSIDSNSQSIIDSVYGNSSSNSGAIPYSSTGIVGDPSANQISNLANSTPSDATTQQAQQQITAIGCNDGSNPALCGDNSTLNSNQAPDAGPQGPCPAGGTMDSSGNCPQPQGPCPSGAMDASGNCPSTNNPPQNNGNTFSGNGGGNTNTTGANTTGSNMTSGRSSGGGLGNILGNLFGGGNAQPSVPQSPFGGACNTRYICQGNMLYYQTASGIGGIGGMGGGYQMVNVNGQLVMVPAQSVSMGVTGAGQCQTMPVQQCQYGCQAIAGTTGANSTLGEIGTGFQIASILLRAFGGGGSNTMTNTNLSSSCAMTPQQAQGYQSPYGTGTDGQGCYQPPPQPDPSQCTSGTWRPTSASQNGCTTGWQCVPNGTAGTGSNGPTNSPPTAQLSCQPQIADVGTPISFSYACGNATGSTGTGFSTGGALSGTTAVPAPTPPAGTNQVSFTLTCVNQGVTASAQCQVQLNKSGIVMITNPKTVNSGDSALIGWVTAGMQSCVVSSPDDQNFTARNANNTSPSGAATTSPITSTENFRLDCTTLAGGTKTATTTVSVASN